MAIHISKPYTMTFLFVAQNLILQFTLSNHFAFAFQLMIQQQRAV